MSTEAIPCCLQDGKPRCSTFLGHAVLCQVSATTDKSSMQRRMCQTMPRLWHAILG